MTGGMIVKRIVVALLTLCLALGVIGCAGITSPTAVEEMSAEEIVEAVLGAARGVETVRFDIDAMVKVTGTAAQPINMTMPTNVSGLIENVSQRMRTETKATLQQPASAGGSTETTVLSYFVDNVLYTQTTVSGEPAQWERAHLAEDSWDEVNQLGRLLEMMRASQVELLPSMDLGGTACYVLNIVPDLQQLQETLAQLPGLADLPTQAEATLREMLESISSKVWVAKDTFLPMREETELIMSIGSAAIGMPPGQDFKIKMHSQIRTDFHNYDEPVSIDLPPDAGG